MKRKIQVDKEQLLTLKAFFSKVYKTSPSDIFHSDDLRICMKIKNETFEITFPKSFASIIPRR